MSTVFALSANARSRAIYIEEGFDGAWVSSPEIVRFLYRIPHLVNNGRVSLLQGYEFSTLLSKNSPDSWYSSKFDKSPEQIQNDRKIFGALDDKMAAAYENLLSHDEIAAHLARYGVSVKPTDWTSPTTYELNDPYIDGVDTFTVESVCVKNHEIVPTYNALARGVLAIPPCADGQIYSVIKFAQVRYDPFCDGVPCRSPDDLINTVQVVPLLTTVVTK